MRYCTPKGVKLSRQVQDLPAGSRTTFFSIDVRWNSTLNGVGSDACDHKLDRQGQFVEKEYKPATLRRRRQMQIKTMAAIKRTEPTIAAMIALVGTFDADVGTFGTRELVGIVE